MSPQTTPFTAVFEVTPSANSVDVVTALSKGPADVWSEQTVIVRFPPSGVIDAINGSAWNAVTSIPYSGGVTYHIRLVVNMAAHTYSAYVTPAGGHELTLATDYGFRTETNTVTSLDTWGTKAYAGSHQVCDFTAVTNSSNTSGDWANFPMPNQTGAFWAEFDATPASSGVDVVTALSKGPAAAWSDQTVLVRFSPAGVIDAINGSAWNAVTSIPYTGNTTYHVRLLVDVPAHTYSAYVRPAGGTEVTLASNYGFRTETNTVTSLDQWNTKAYAGSHQTANFIAPSYGGDATPPTISAVKSAPGSDKSAVMWTTDEGSDSRVEYGLSAGYGSMTPVQSSAVTEHTVLVTGLVPQKVYHYRVRSTDPAGNLSLSGDRTFSTSPSGTLASFPGAQGAGATAAGGRGGTVMLVTNLNDAGGGSLRACMEQGSGARTCVFRVGGTINLNTAIRVFNPNLTVAGQTAPGGGIMLRGSSNPENQVVVYDSNVVIRYLRIRAGYNASRPPGSQGGDPLVMGDKAEHVMADHLSLSWSTDENASVWDGTTAGTPREISLSYSLLAEALEGHSTGFLTGSQNNDAGARLMTNVDLHHSMFSNHTHRAPLLKNMSSRLVNNIIYNNDYHNTQLKGGINADIIGNLYKKGSLQPNANNPHEINAFADSSPTSNAVIGAPSIYLLGNKGWNQTNPGGDQWQLAGQTSGENQGEIGPIPSGWHRGSPLAAAGVPIFADDVNNLEGILSGSGGVGASSRLDCNGNWVSNRDAVDSRLMSQYASGTGDYPRAPSYENGAGFGWPVIASGTACTDADNDGMADAWETANGLSPSNPADANALAANGSGYTNLDMYLAGMRAR